MRNVSAMVACGGTSSSSAPKSSSTGTVTFVRFHNSGKTEVDVAADAWNVWGVRYGNRERAAFSDQPNPSPSNATFPKRVAGC